MAEQPPWVSLMTLVAWHIGDLCPALVMHGSEIQSLDDKAHENDLLGMLHGCLTSAFQNMWRPPPEWPFCSPGTSYPRDPFSYSHTVSGLCLIRRAS